MFTRVNLTEEELNAVEMKEEFELACGRNLVPNFILDMDMTNEEKMSIFYNWIFYAHYGVDTQDIAKLQRVNREELEDSDELILDSHGEEKMPGLGELVYFKFDTLLSENVSRQVIARLDARKNTSLNIIMRCLTCTKLVPIREAHSLGPCGHSFCTLCVNRQQATASRIPRALGDRQAYIYQGRACFPCPFCRTKVDCAIPIYRP